MFGGMSPAKMQGMMKKMGISQVNLPVKRVVFEMDDGNLVIEEPSVTKISMQGQVSFQVSGETRNEESDFRNQISEDDVKMVMEKTGKSLEEVREMLEKVGGDIAEAIVELGGV
ncbi:MAG: nascent polypeptide-associated complex protein [archaeon]